MGGELAERQVFHGGNSPSAPGYGCETKPRFAWAFGELGLLNPSPTYDMTARYVTARFADARLATSVVPGPQGAFHEHE